ncbi:MAG: sulfite exporter TauE/SafE family protein [Hyphomicrobiaceae bacterium]|nr:sulfite exporter TauE/SafE family protein [Hyphomicrobiaceae bacterium]
MPHSVPERRGRLATAIRRWVPVHLAILATAYAAIWIVKEPNVAAVMELWFFAPIGVFGAIIANATGTGGGVVFVPAFNAIGGGAIQLQMDIAELIRITPDNTVGMSFVIQCFGMSIGTLVWLTNFFAGGKIPHDERITSQAFFGIAFAVLCTTIPSLLITQQFNPFSGPQLLGAFKIFSIILGVTLLVFSLKHDRFAPKNHRLDPAAVDYWALIGIGVIGGAVTALFSVGVGEFLAIYLILRRFPTTAAIAIAVVVSVITVFSGVWFHVARDSVIWEIVVLAIPGAMFGGFIAKIIALKLGAQRLKILASFWIILSSLYLIFGPSVELMP